MMDYTKKAEIKATVDEAVGMVTTDVATWYEAGKWIGGVFEAVFVTPLNQGAGQVGAAGEVYYEYLAAHHPRMGYDYEDVLAYFSWAMTCRLVKLGFLNPIADEPMPKWMVAEVASWS